MSICDDSRLAFRASHAKLVEAFPKLRLLKDAGASPGEKKQLLNEIHSSVTLFLNAFERMVSDCRPESQASPDIEREFSNGALSLLDFVLNYQMTIDDYRLELDLSPKYCRPSRGALFYARDLVNKYHPVRATELSRDFSSAGIEMAEAASKSKEAARSSECEKPGAIGFLQRLNPYKVLQDAIQAVPALRYALGVLGIVAVIAIISAWQIDFKVAVFGVIIAVSLMTGLLLFAKLVNIESEHFLLPSKVFLWFIVVLLMVSFIVLFSAAVFQKPEAFYRFLFQNARINKSASSILDGRMETGKASIEQIIIDDFHHLDFPLPKTDFRIRNAGTNEITISRVYFKVIDYSEAGSLLSKQQISDVAAIKFDKDTKQGALLNAPIALTLGPGESDRFIVSSSWIGERSHEGRYYMIVPGLKTPVGIKRGKPFRLHMQQQVEGEEQRMYSLTNKVKMTTNIFPQLISVEKADTIPIDWSK